MNETIRRFYEQMTLEQEDRFQKAVDAFMEARRQIRINNEIFTTTLDSRQAEETFERFCAFNDLLQEIIRISLANTSGLLLAVITNICREVEADFVTAAKCLVTIEADGGTLALPKNPENDDYRDMMSRYILDLLEQLETSDKTTS